MTAHHPLVFKRFAGSFQLRIRTFDDLLAIKHLPEVHWVALAAPTEGLNCDKRFLGYLDNDANGRVRVRELKAEIEWLAERLADRSNCVPGSDVLVLDHLAPGAGSIRATAQLVLDNLRAEDRTRISLAQMRQTEQITRKGDANGDGVISPSVVEDPELRVVVEDILTHQGGIADISGEVGVDQGVVKAFREARAKALAWVESRGAAFTWGDHSLDRALLVRGLTSRIDEYFLQCRLVASQPESAGQLRIGAESIAGVLGDLERLKRTVATLPVAPADPLGHLSWAARYRGDVWEALEQLRTLIAAPMFGDAVASGLAESQWNRIKDEAKPILAWHDQQNQHPLLALGVDRLRAIDDRWIDALDQLCANDKKLGEILARLSDLEKLILYQRWIFTFVNNFVSMPDLYNADNPALFEQGTLIMAGREFSLAVLVPNRAAHAAYSAESTMFTMYLEISGGAPARKFEVAVPVTSGTSGGIFVGKRGVFRAVDGMEYDAVVVQLIVQPVSLYEAMTSPFTRIGKFFTSRIEKWSASADKDFEKQVEAKASAPVPAAPVPAAPAKPGQPAPANPAGMGGMLMGGSVAFAAVGSGLAYIIKQVSETPPLNLVYGLIIVCSLVAVPTTILAYLKLRRRNLALILEASGWALNERLKLTGKLGRLFTRRRRRPAGSRFELIDEVGKLLSRRSKDSDDEEEPRWGLWWLAGSIPALLVLAAIGWWMFGPSSYATRKRIEAQIVQLKPQLDKRDAYSDVAASYVREGGGELIVGGTVPTAKDLAELNDLIDSTRPRWFAPTIQNRVTVQVHAAPIAAPAITPSPISERPVEAPAPAAEPAPLPVQPAP